jgi:hypothetical protein
VVPSVLSTRVGKGLDRQSPRARKGRLLGREIFLVGAILRIQLRLVWEEVLDFL